MEMFTPCAPRSSPSLPSCATVQERVGMAGVFRSVMMAKRSLSLHARLSRRENHSRRGNRNTVLIPMAGSKAYRARGYGSPAKCLLNNIALTAASIRSVATTWTPLASYWRLHSGQAWSRFGTWSHSYKQERSKRWPQGWLTTVPGSSLA